MQRGVLDGEHLRQTWLARRRLVVHPFASIFLCDRATCQVSIRSLEAQPLASAASATISASVTLSIADAPEVPLEGAGSLVPLVTIVAVSPSATAHHTRGNLHAEAIWVRPALP